MFEQLLRRFWSWILNEFLALRATFRSRNEGAFHMNASDPLDRRSTIANRVQDIDHRCDRRCRSCQQKRCRTAARVVIANRAKSFRRGLHRVAAKRAVNVKIDKPRREIGPTKINNVFSARPRLFTNLCNRSISRDKFEAIANSVGENAARVSENHLLVGRDSVEPTKFARKIRRLRRASRYRN